MISTTLFVQGSHRNGYPCFCAFDLVEFYTQCDTCAFKMRNREPIKVVRHIPRNACHISMRSGGAVWGNICSARKAHV